MRPLEDIWSELAAKPEGPAYFRVDEHHPLDLYVGLDTNGARLLVLLTSSEPSVLMKRFEAFEIASHHRQDGRWTLTVRLRKPEFSRIFAQLCQDLVDASRAGCSVADAPYFVLGRISRWERLLTRDRSGLLDESGLRGLIGELIFLQQFSIPYRGLRAALEAWMGPLAADQDFHFPDRFVEVKTIGDGSSRVTISSAEQLETFERPLFLTVISIEFAAQPTEATFNVTQLVSNLKDVLRSEPESFSLFEERLALTGYEERQEYEDRTFLLQAVRHYAVKEGFPRIRRSELPSAIGMVHYELDLSRCRDFECSSCLE